MKGIRIVIKFLLLLPNRFIIKLNAHESEVSQAEVVKDPYCLKTDPKSNIGH